MSEAPSSFLFPSTSWHNDDHEEFMNKVIPVIHNINKTLTNKIDIEKIEQLFIENADLKSTILKIDSEVFCDNAKKYDIKPFQSHGILTALRHEFHGKYAKRERMQWVEDSQCEIYSKSLKQWYPGKIVQILKDEQGEWLNVRYMVNETTRTKEIQRYNRHIRVMKPQKSQKQRPRRHKNVNKITPVIDEYNDPILQKRNSMPIMLSSPLSVISEDEQKTKPLWRPKKSHDRSRTMSTFTFSVPSTSPHSVVTLDDIERQQRSQWEKGTKCQTYSVKARKWLKAVITDIYDDDNGNEWLFLKCSDNTMSQMDRYNDNIRGSLGHKRNVSMISTQSNLPIQFDQRSMNSLLKKLSNVIDSINHDIDSSHNFLYQVYYVNDMDDIEEYITYEHDKAMEHYRETIAKKYSTSMLCNGKILKEYGEYDICERCTIDAGMDYDKIYESLHSEKLDKNEILTIWMENTDKYDQKWLLSITKEDFVAEIIDLLKIDTIQNAMKLYDKLVSAIKYEGDEAKLQSLDNMKDEECYDIMLLWTKKNTEDNIMVKSLDHTHFLYIVSFILERLKTLDDGERYDEVDIKAILQCLRKIKMNGLLFSKIDENTFIGSVIIHSHSFKEVKVKALSQLVAISKALYDEIKNFNLESIKPSSIFSISLTDRGNEGFVQSDDDKKVLTAIHKHMELDTFHQWMITFDSQFNRNTPFNQKVFNTLIKTYKDNPHVVINMKYDNYSKDLTQKTYNDVLKSFIAWSITLKCSNLRCEERLKLCCFCDINRFQKYTYKIIMAIIKLKANNNYTLLNQLTNTSNNMAILSNAFGDVLPDVLKEHKYYKEYRTFIIKWINFEFYNFRCEYCLHVNKTIMIDRVYQYSKSMDSCRVCNKRQISRVRNNQPQFDIERAIIDKEFIANKKREYKYSEFNLHSLKEYLSTLGVSATDSDAFLQYLHDNVYDSDAIMYDLKEKTENSHIYQAIQSINPGLYALVKRYLNYDQYPSYKIGKLIRYVVLRPKYFSFLKEVCLNDIHPLSQTEWELKILENVLKQYNKKTIRSEVTDERFGIEEKEPIGIPHLIAIFLFTDDRFRDYSTRFARSYWLFDANVHTNNFYWMGRYLYESVQFYGKKFSANAFRGIFRQGIDTVRSFDSIAPVFNAPTLVTNDENAARKFAGNKGCVLILRPKYIGDIDQSKILHTTLFNRKIRLIKGTKLQIESIHIMSPPQNLERIVLALQYIEKLLLQTEFDVHFYNSDNLYESNTMRNAYKLIQDRIGHTQQKAENYAQHLFENWCFKRNFVTFETFKLEMNYMDYRLKEFLFDKKRNKINIINVKKFLPNLNHYHDINGVLRKVSMEIKHYKRIIRTTDDNNDNIESFGLLYNCQSHDIPYHIVNALEDIHFQFSLCDGVLRTAFKMKLANLDEINFASFYENNEEFMKQLVSIGMTEKVAKYCIQSIKKEEQIHMRTESQTLIEHTLNRLQTQFGIESNLKCDLFTQKEAFKKLYFSQLQRFTTAVNLQEHVRIADLYDVASNIKIFKAETAMILSKYLYMKMMDDKEKRVPWECSFCEFMNRKMLVDGLWRYYNEGNKCGLCGEPRYAITNTVHNNTKNREGNHRRIIRRQTLAFSKFKTSNHVDDVKETDHVCPDVDVDNFLEIDDVTECTLFKSVQHLAHNQLLFVLNNHFFQQIAESDKIKSEQKKKLMGVKGDIVQYFREEKLDGMTFVSIKKSKFVKHLKKFCGDNKLHAPLIYLYNTIKECDLRVITDIPSAVYDDESKEIDYEALMNCCPAYCKIKLILEHFDKATKELHRGDDVDAHYPYKMNLYLSYYPGYTPVDFLNDVDHIIKHKLKHPQKCGKGKECIHIRRALRDRDTKQCKTLDLKKEFFSTDREIDFPYISMLDRAHCLLKHSDDIAHKIKSKVTNALKGDVMKVHRLHLPYNTGVYMEYHTLKPLYQNLFDEVIGNKKLKITEEQVNSDLEASKLFLKTEHVIIKWRSCKTDSKYGIKINERIHIEHVLCIKFYCNYSDLCQMFRRSYRKHNVTDTTDDIIQRHCNGYYWFGRFLTTAIEFWEQIPETSDVFYHGLTDKFVFHHFSTVYEIPTSTTNEITVAQNFCDDNGVVLQLAPKYTNEVNNSRCLDVSGLSEFKEEKEKLFAGMTVLTIKNIYSPSDNEWKGYADYVAAFLYFERIIEQTIHQKEYYNFGKLSSHKQRTHLIPLLLHQMKRNNHTETEEKKQNDDGVCIPSYICTLFEFFCDNKKDYIDLSCINEEISFMSKELQDILFKSVNYDEENTEMITKYKIKNENLKLIFPNLMEYKNHMGYWIYVGPKSK